MILVSNFRRFEAGKQLRDYHYIIWLDSTQLGQFNSSFRGVHVMSIDLMHQITFYLNVTANSIKKEAIWIGDI